MPELPEVETTRRGLAPHLTGRLIVGVEVREPRLRWPVALPEDLVGRRIEGLGRRGKYLLIDVGEAVVIVHLGMSGSLRMVPSGTPPGRHEHLDLALDSGFCLRLKDPRRFGSVHFHEGAGQAHRLLEGLGPEPFDAALDGDYLFERARGRRQAVKTFIMDARTVVGVGNIYASEALFRAGIRPGIAARRVSRRRYGALADAIRRTLAEAIRSGGTTLRDFVGGDGAPGYFRQALCVYGRAGESCRVCGTAVTSVRLGSRSTFYCRKCQA